MNPFLERTWHPVHTALIGFIWEEIAGRLPEDLVARPEERLAIDELEPSNGYRTDMAMIETWRQGAAPSWLPTGEAAGEGVTVAEPQIFRVEEDVHRWIEIRTEEGRVVTALEVLSPGNKDTDRERYRRKQADYLRSTASLVEIDLLRSGRFVLPVAEREIRKPPGTCYYICASRAWRPTTREVYCCPLRERLPAIRIPLRPTDQDLTLDLQPLIDRCYELGRYYKGRFDVIPDPPFPPDEATWVEEHLRAAGLRG